MALNAGTYEAQIINWLGQENNAVRFTCADATAISKGTLMRLKDPVTAIKNGAGTYNVAIPVAGIAAADKVANDGSTTIGCYRGGIWELRADGGTHLITAGDLVAISGANNQIRKAYAADIVSGAVLGTALEDATASEEIAVLVKC